MRVMIIMMMIAGMGIGNAGCHPKPAETVAQPATQAPMAREFPVGINPAQTSDDPTYGYTKENPIRLGMKDEFSGPAASQVYLRHLRDTEFKPLRFERVGSFGGNPDGHMIDLYRLTSAKGQKFEIYIDMYHPENTPLQQPAPMGLYFWK